MRPVSQRPAPPPARARLGRTGRSRGIEVISPAPRDLWREVLASDPNALVFQTPEWLDCVSQFGPYEDSSRLYELADGRRLVLPMVRRLNLPKTFRTEASLPPTWNPGGIAAPGGVHAQDVVAVLDDLAKRRIFRASLRPGPLDAEAWAPARRRNAVRIPRLAHVLALDGGFERVWGKRFKGTARTAVRKAERAGLTVERDTSGQLVSVLYELFDRSMERWARQQKEPMPLARWRRRHVDPIRKFELIAETLGEMCRIWVAWCDGQPAAAILVLQGQNASYVRGAMDKDLAGPTRANYLLHRLAIEEACDAGCHYYDMGETGASESLAQFKTRFGARPYPYAEYHIERIPITAVDGSARRVAKTLIGFRD